MGVPPQGSRHVASASAEPGSLASIAEYLSVLTRRVAAGDPVDRSFVVDCDRALVELNVLRELLARRIAGNDRRVESLKRIDAALADLASVFASVPCNALNRAAVGQRSGSDASLRRAIRRAAVFLGLSVAGVGLVAPAFAEDSITPTYVGMTPEDVGVLQRSRPEYDAKGIPLGAFRLFPSLDASANYDDNVLRTPTATSDWFFEEAPSRRLVSQWGRHFLEIYGGLDNYNYASLSRLNLTDWTVGGDGRYDISRAMDLSAAVSYGEYHEQLSSPNTVGFQKSSNRYDKTHADATGRFQPNRLGFSIGGSYDRFDWKNTPKIGGGTLFNTDRNEDEYQGFAKVNYDFSPGYSGYIKGLYDARDFDLHLDRTGVDRSSHGYRVDAGVNLQLTHLLAGEIYVGYLDQQYQAPLKDVSGVDYGVNLDWFATPVLTVHLNGAHQINDVVLSGTSASDDKLIKLSADYEFRYNVILQGYVSYTDSTLTGTARDDEYPGAGIGVKYLLNEYMSANINYNYSERSSNFASVGYTDDTISLGLTAHI